MASATEILLKPEAKPPVRRRRSFHRRYHKLILAGRVLLGVALVVGLFAIADFTYNAFAVANCYTASTDDSGSTPQLAVKSPECVGVLARSNDYMRLDAGIALLGIAILLSSVVCYRKARRYRPRARIRPTHQH